MRYLFCLIFVLPEDSETRPGLPPLKEATFEDDNTVTTTASKVL
jgi:hypothetical protein